VESELRVLRQFKRAEEDAVDKLADQIVDQFLSELAHLDPFNQASVSATLQESGITAENLNSLQSGRQGSSFVKALGGLVVRSLWYALVRPFLILRKLIRAPKFRQAIKQAFKRALRRELRSTRHLADVISRWAQGAPVHPQEFKAAQQQLLRLLVKVLLIYFAAPEIGGLFTGGVWHAISTLWFPAEEVVALLLDRPLGAVLSKLLTEPSE
jgi:hypothetical protein